MALCPLQLNSANAKFIHLLCKDGDPLQLLREFVKNSLLAGATRISLHPDFPYARRTLAEGHRVDKIAIVDNGCGMDEVELPDYFLTLALSGPTSLKDLLERFGLGGKISSLPLNHAGVTIISYKNGVGNMIRMGYENGSYGLMSLDDNGDICVETEGTEYDAEYKRDHGTIVILHGMTEDENTYPLPGYSAADMLKYLNRRFFTVPEGVTIEVFEPPADKANWATDVKKSRNRGKYQNHMRTIHGAQYYYDSYSIEKDTMKVPHGKLHWWAFGDPDRADSKNGTKDDKRASSLSKSIYGVHPGSTGFLFQDEVYEYSTHANRLTQAGLVSRKSRRRVAMIYEPDAETVTPNPSRSRLRSPHGENGNVPWGLVGLYFVEHMPDTIQKIVTDHTDIQFDDLETSVHKGLDRLKDLLNWKRVKGGKSTPTREHTGEHTDHAPRRENRRGKGKTFPRIVVGDQEKPMFPVEYTRNLNQIVLQPAHHMIRDLLAMFQADFAHIPGSDSVILNAVMKVYGLQAAQAVLMARHLKEKRVDDGYQVFKAMTEPMAMLNSVSNILTIETQVRPILHGTFQQKGRKVA